MRLARAFLLSTLTISTASVALANEAPHAYSQAEATKSRVPLRIVKMLPDTHQVLLHDRIRGTHVVAEVGQDIHGYVVEDIRGDEVTLIAENGAEVILTAPSDPAWRRRIAERRAAGNPAAVAPAEPAPVDPYAPYATSAGDVQIQPGEGGVRVASAASTSYETSAAPASATPPATPADPYPMDPAIAAFVEAAGSPAPAATPSSSADGAASQAPARADDVQASAAPAPAKADDRATALAMAATGSSPAPTTSGHAPTVPAPTSAVPTAATAPTSAAPTAAAPDTALGAGVSTFTVARRDIETALSDFGATAATFDATFVANGLRIDSVHAGTILAQLGLRAGDVITSVDGLPLRSFDDAANLYARAGSAKMATIAVLRGGAPTIFRVEIR